MKKWIPKLNKSGLNLKSISVEALILLGLFAMVSNIVIIPRIHSKLGVPTIIGIVLFAVILALPSHTNEQKSTLSALILFLKFRIRDNQRANKQQRTGGVRLKFMNFFNRDKVKLKKNIQHNKMRLDASALEDSGIETVGDETYTDKAGNEYAVYMYEYININGISREIDEENKDHQATLFDSLETRGKLHFPVYNNRPLQDSFDYFNDLMGSTPYQEEVEEMLMWMNYFNNQTQNTKTIDVHVNDLDSFHRNNAHLEVTRFTGDDLIKHLHDRQLGGFENS
ncbi:hypothetical protein [Erysipelothrix aquatica]|uniref:hypothetical protein n=1 Tax=Erysipelothrix aquatica TaxID=2683714 RepID=UPI00135B3838|nr:hypothetical protein [Erysipelothrix aquatica]